MNKGWKYGIGLGMVIVLLFMANLLIGSVPIPVSDVFSILMGHEGEKASWSFIVWESRLPQALTALLCGGALAVCGLMLQTAFKNPLAGPSILGINSGASLGVAFVFHWFWWKHICRNIQFVRFLLRIGWGVCRCYADNGTYPFLFYAVKKQCHVADNGYHDRLYRFVRHCPAEFLCYGRGVQSYMVWGLGNFGGVSLQQMPAFALVTVAGLFGSLLLIKPLNALLLGERYAENLGINIRYVRNWLLVITGLLTAITTAFCGPVAFIGLAVPHIARMVLRTANHNSLLPVTILSGGAVALLCNLICVLPGEAGIIPLNAVTPIIGAPVIIYVIVSQRGPQRFN